MLGEKTCRQSVVVEKRRGYTTPAAGAGMQQYQWESIFTDWGQRPEHRVHVVMSVPILAVS